MPRLSSNVSLYTRTDGKYRLTDDRAFYAEGTAFVLRYELRSGKDRRRVWETLAAKDHATARRIKLEKELALASPPPKPVASEAPEDAARRSRSDEHLRRNRQAHRLLVRGRRAQNQDRPLGTDDPPSEFAGSGRASARPKVSDAPT